MGLSYILDERVSIAALLVHILFLKYHTAPAQDSTLSSDENYATVEAAALRVHDFYAMDSSLLPEKRHPDEM